MDTPKRLSEILSERGLTPAMVEVRAHVSISTLRRACAGRVPPELHMVALSRFLKMSVAEVRASIEACAAVKP